MVSFKMIFGRMLQCSARCGMNVASSIPQLREKVTNTIILVCRSFPLVALPRRGKRGRSGGWDHILGRYHILVAFPTTVFIRVARPFRLMPGVSGVFVVQGYSAERSRLHTH